jgi:hypothetical protein
MRTSIAIIALLGLASQDVEALSLERRHRHRQVQGVTFVNQMDEEPDKEQ